MLRLPKKKKKSWIAYKALSFLVKQLILQWIICCVSFMGKILKTYLDGEKGGKSSKRTSRCLNLKTLHLLNFPPDLKHGLSRWSPRWDNSLTWKSIASENTFNTEEVLLCLNLVSSKKGSNQVLEILYIWISWCFNIHKVNKPPKWSIRMNLHRIKKDKTKHCIDLILPYKIAFS